ncbi:BadF/BadG/BcrA/BcrD ATPase family protein [Kribbella yunnanensis]|uniref:BadF/BadG/BcrA/BcrD ATPase family protein n=1 Tax=Kribbella yunnanensis TaxID=190194 RepID=A0ABP4UR22_9ACTN
MKVNVAIDGGQSALRLRVLPTGATGVGSGYIHGPHATDHMLEAIRGAATEAGLAVPGGGARPTVGVVALGLTGYPPAPGAAEAFAAQVLQLLGADEVRLTQDMVTAHAGALPDGYGVVVAAGTGLVCLAVDRDGSWHKLDGHGYLFGDAGSAFAIGRAGLRAVQRARDGRGPVTKLAETTLDPIAYYRSQTLVDDVARFAPDVLRCAAEGDVVALDILAGAAADIAETIEAAVKKLVGTDPVPVACVGGLFAGAGEQLLDPVRAVLSARAHLVPAAGSSLDGAERLATAEPGPYTALTVIQRKQ